jgi:hypothetical protein
MHCSLILLSSADNETAIAVTGQAHIFTAASSTFLYIKNDDSNGSFRNSVWEFRVSYGVLKKVCVLVRKIQNLLSSRPASRLQPALFVIAIQLIHVFTHHGKEKIEYRLRDTV